MQSLERDSCILPTKAATLTVALTPEERDALDAICGRGKKEKKGHWVAQAIREKLEREGLLQPEAKA
jgi:hypothetical protein